MRAVLTLVLLLAPLTTAAAGRSFLWPTGELERPGEVVITQHEMAALLTFTVGLGERLELELMVPPAPLGGQLQLRAALLPRSSPFRLAVGVAGGGVLLDPGRGWLSGASATGGWAGERLEVHATVMAYRHHGVDAGIGVLAVGGSLRLGRRAWLTADAGRFSLLLPGDCDDACPSFGVARAATVGVRAVLGAGGRGIDLELGLLYLPEVFPEAPLPLLSITHRH